MQFLVQNSLTKNNGDTKQYRGRHHQHRSAGASPDGRSGSPSVMAAAEGHGNPPHILQRFWFPQPCKIKPSLPTSASANVSPTTPDRPPPPCPLWNRRWSLPNHPRVQRQRFVSAAPRLLRPSHRSLPLVICRGEKVSRRRATLLILPALLPG